MLTERRPFFLTRLRTEHLEKPWVLLLEPLVYCTWLDGRPVLIIVPAGFVCDLASVPRLPIIFAMCGDTAKYAAVLHDYVCREGWPWMRGAWLFREAMMADPYPEPRWRAEIMFSGVVVRGALPYEARPGVLDPR